MDYRLKAIDKLRHIREYEAAYKVRLDKLRELDDQLKALKIPSPKSDPVQGGGTKVEERWLNLIAEKGEVQDEEFEHTKRRVKRFNTAWAALSERDKRVLTLWYIEKYRGDKAQIVADELKIARCTAYVYRDEALENFALAYYGAVKT